MRYLVLAVLFLSLVGTAFGQRGTYSSLGGFGNVLYPGTGHAPAMPPGGINGPYFRGAFSGGRGFGGGFPANHPRHDRSSVVLYPVFFSGYGGYGYPYDPSSYPDQPQPAMDPNSVPSVVINQNFVPQQAAPVVREYSPEPAPEQSGMKLYQNSSHPYADAGQAAAGQARRAANDEEPTLYLIAFKDHTIVQALGYWMEGGALHYVSVEHTLNQASLDLIDRNLSQRLNDERGVEFKLPVR